MKEHPIWYRVIGLFILIVPTLIYLCFLVPCLSEEYNVLMASGGIIGGAGFYASSLIPAEKQYSSLYKTACNSFTVLVVITLVEKFIIQLVFLVALFIVCFITYKILEGVYKNAVYDKKSRELSKQIASSIVECSK